MSGPCERDPRHRPGGHRRSGAAERRQQLRPPRLPRARGVGLDGERIRRPRRLAAARRGGARRPRARRRADSGWRGGAPRRPDRVDRPRGARAARAPAAAGRARTHAAGPPSAGRRGRRGPRPRARGPRGRHRRRHHQRMDPTPVGGAVWAARRPGARGRGRRRQCPSRTGKRGRRRAAVRRGAEARQGARRADRRARGDGRPLLALHLCGQPRPRPGLRRRGAPACAGRRAGRSGSLPGAVHGRGAGPRLRRRGPARARLPRRDLRHGRHRGAVTRPAGHRHRCRRSRRGAWPWGARHPAGAARPVRRCGRPRRRPARLARERRLARSAAPGGARAARAAAPVGGDRFRRRRRPRGSCLEREGRLGSRGGGAVTAETARLSPKWVRVSPEWLGLREPADAAARSAGLAERLRLHLAPAGRLEIHDLGGGSGAMGRWLAPRLPGPQHWVVHDRDEDLLELAVTDAPTAATVEAKSSDLTRLTRDELAGASFVTASALLDLLTAETLARVLAACAGCPMLLTLTVVGRVTLTPEEWLDASMSAAFNAHQRRDRKLGPDAVAAATLAVLVWHLGTGPFLDGLHAVDGWALAAASGLAVLTTLCCAWRWRVVARGLGVELALGTAVAAYYCSLFLNVTLPGGVVGDVHRGISHGRDTSDIGRGLGGGGLERAAGQVVQVVITVAMLLVLPSPVHAVMPLVALALIAVAICAALAARAYLRDWLPAWRAWPVIALASTLVLAGHVATFLIASRSAGVTAPTSELLPLALLVMQGAALPNLGGWGPREGVTAWAFAAAGLGASLGVATAVVYGVMVFVASLPGAAVLVAAALRVPARLEGVADV